MDAIIFLQKRLSSTLWARMGSDEFSPIKTELTVRCSGGLYKAWFTHRLNINSTLTPRDSRWRLLCPDPPDRVRNTTFVSQGPWDCWKFHTVFQGFLPSFLDFYLHSLSFENVREKWCQMLNFPQCPFSLGYCSFKSWSLCWSIGQWHKPNLLHGLKRKT